MTQESSLRAHADSRILDLDANQAYSFDVLEESIDEQLLADYRQRYGLSEDPFAQDYSFPLFTGAGRRHLLDQLLHLCQFSNSVLAVLGEIGVGKTRIAHAFMDSLSDRDQICFLSLQSDQTLEYVLNAMVQTFGINAGPLPSADNLLAAIESFIAQEALAEEDGLAVVVIDNAQLLDDQTLSVLTGLLNNFPQQHRLHLAMLGDPSLMRRLERVSPETLLINDFYLSPFSLAEATDYLNFRMEMADYLGPEIFTESMVDPWWRQAQGQLGILHECAQQRLLDSVTPKPGFNKRSLPVAHIVALSFLIALVGVVFLYMGDEKDEAIPSIVTSGPIPADSQAAGSTGVLTSTSTPVQPLLQTLPQPQQPNQMAVQTPVQSNQPIAPPEQQSVAVVEEGDFTREEVVPLAQLPTSPAKMPNTQSAAATAQSQSVIAEPQPAVVESTPAVAQPASTIVELTPAVVEPPLVKAETQVVNIQPESKAVAQQRPLATTASPEERNILAWNPAGYTVQLLGVSNRKSALDYIAAQPNKNDLLLFKSKRQGNDWFVVITGRFSSSIEARQAIARLPVKQRDAGPWPRDIKTIQSEIKAAL